MSLSISEFQWITLIGVKTVGAVGAGGTVTTGLRTKQRTVLRLARIVMARSGGTLGKEVRARLQVFETDARQTKLRELLSQQEIFGPPGADLDEIRDIFFYVPPGYSETREFNLGDFVINQKEHLLAQFTLTDGLAAGEELGLSFEVLRERRTKP